MSRGPWYRRVASSALQKIEIVEVVKPILSTASRVSFPWLKLHSGRRASLATKALVIVVNQNS